MEVNILFKIAAIGIVISIINSVLIRSGREEQAQFTTLAGVILVLLMIIPLLTRLFSNIRTMFQIYY
ncbi:MULTISPECIES: stage III sporulation protein AC [Thermovenabulum]|uniref:Stage III sporulation protein AC n=1 Tax=Thermovenabulum gondwanense TaxID=520767 RepID=A0A162MGU8_9FIRM|nr:stage III sporulation protein AC [Thermovenabulum gondwanense]KYO65825.1 hypothetical protein ATZ99_14630 [Thermovenabulum gondwanense]